MKIKKIICILIALSICLCFASCGNKSTTALSNNSVIFFETDNDADCALIHCDDVNILVDTGEKGDSKQIIEFLTQNGIDELDCIIFSHFDKDHCGGAVKILNEIKVNKIIHSEYIKDSKETKKLFKLVNELNVTNTSISQREELNIGNVLLTFLPPESSSYNEKQSNNSSLVVKAVINNHSVLFTGDSQEERVSELLNSNEDLSADVLKLMYHGREVSNEIDLIERINPSYTIITSKSDKDKVEDNLEGISFLLGNYYFTCEESVIFDLDKSEITVVEF